MDPISLGILNTAITASGGLATISSIQAVVTTGVQTSGTRVDNFKWEEAGREYRYDYSRQEDGHKQSLASGHGSPVAQVNGGTVFPLTKFSYVQHIPFDIPIVYLVACLAGPAAVISQPTASQTDTANPARVVIRFQNVSGKLSPEELWTFDPQTNLPVSVRYYAPGLTPFSPGEVLRAKFLNYQTESGIMLPQLIELHGPSEGFVISYQVDTITLNPTINVSDFNLQ